MIIIFKIWILKDCPKLWNRNTLGFKSQTVRQWNPQIEARTSQNHPFSLKHRACKKTAFTRPRSANRSTFTSRSIMSHLMMMGAKISTTPSKCMGIHNTIFIRASRRRRKRKDKPLTLSWWAKLFLIKTRAPDLAISPTKSTCSGSIRNAHKRMSRRYQNSLIWVRTRSLTKRCLFVPHLFSPHPLGRSNLMISKPTSQSRRIHLWYP